MLKTYFHCRKRLVILVLAINIINVLILFLYNCPLDGIIYALILEGLFGLGFFGYDLYKYYERVLYLRRIKSQLTLAPFPKLNQVDLYEKEYQAMLFESYEKYRHQNELFLNKQQEMVDYYSMWVHQIKTPIAALNLLLQNQEVPDFACQNELFKIEQYVEMVLSYLRLESESTDYYFERLSLDQMIREAIHKYSRLFIQKKLSLDFQETNLYVLTDEKWFVFVLSQLLSNAIKYTEQGCIHIYGKDGSLYIEDEGIGITSEDLPRVFERGYTGYNGRVDKKASGIGLYLTKQVLQRLNIDISITSTPKVGTCVKLDLRQRQLEVE